MYTTTDLRSYQPMAEFAAQEATARARERLQMRASGQESWYITRRGRRFKEDRLSELFKREAFEYYLPKIRRMVKIPKNRLTIKQRKSGTAYKEAKLFPLLPSYLFVRFDRRRRDWRDLFTEAHILGMIFSEDAGETIPVLILDREIDRLRGFEMNGAIPESTPIREVGYKIGEEVRITEGAFQYYTAVINDLPHASIGDVDEDVIFKVTIWLFGRPNLVELPLSAIAKL